MKSKNIPIKKQVYLKTFAPKCCIMVASLGAVFLFTIAGLLVGAVEFNRFLTTTERSPFFWGGIMAHKLGRGMTGHHHSIEAKNKIGLANKGNKYWVGRKHSNKTKLKISMANMGKKRTPEQIARISASHKDKQWGENNPFWRGGISDVNERIRQSKRYAKWRFDVFKRDKFTCQECGNKQGGMFQAHHKIPFYKLFAEARNKLPLLDPYFSALSYEPLWSLGNGITLCENCHKNKKHGRAVWHQ